ncbi:hypothetical protein CDL12_23565 [Handroanthus impetiginosus]|uniref:Uncharacterized protein n=1 Tax=Handroanthus impetiginosus TaxID=429701 RepID=A0A2G9GF38_9LAMI|nr:hypothetical protein CDL12_23565 [Handroanthus impetiginosus]
MFCFSLKKGTRAYLGKSSNSIQFALKRKLYRDTSLTCYTRITLNIITIPTSSPLNKAQECELKEINCTTVHCIQKWVAFFLDIIIIIMSVDCRGLCGYVLRWSKMKSWVV